MYGPDYIMLARSDDGDESNIDVETATFFSGATEVGSWLLVAVDYEECPSRSQLCLGLCVATTSACQGLS